MARPGVTYTEVENAIARLQGRDETISINNIRAILKTGSQGTIGSHLRVWRERHDSLGANNLALPDDLQNLVKGLWENLCSKAKEAIEEHKEACDKKISEARQEITTNQKALGESQKQLEATGTLLQQKTDLADQLQTKLNLEQQETNKLNERISSLETRRQDTVGENKKLHEHIKHLQSNLEHYQTTIQKQQQTQSLELEKLRNKLQATEAELVNQVASLNKTNVSLETSNQQYQQQISHLQKTLSTVETEHKGCQKQRDQIEVKLTFLQEENNKLSTQLNSTLSLLESEKNQHQECKVQLKIKAELLNEKQLALVQAGEKLESAEAKIMELLHKNNLLVRDDKAKR